MDSDEQNYDMLDVLAYNCNELSIDLSDIKSNENQNKILLDYISKADNEHKSINDFKEGMYIVHNVLNNIV